MAISVSIPKEITEYEEKIMFGLSLRKLVCFIIAILLAVGTFFLCTMILGLSMDTTSYIIIFEAIPLMAIGFVKKDGMTFEKYAALILRHKIGLNKLSYECTTLIETIPEPEKNDECGERKSKYAWIFEKGNKERKHKLNSKERKIAKQRREAKIFEVTKKDRKRKCKEARRKIKAAKQEYRAVKRREKKATKKNSNSKEYFTAN